MPKYLRKIIRISALDSPNVQLGLRQKELGVPDTGLDENGRMIVPGVLSYEEYKKRLKIWDQVRQCISLDGCFWEGAEFLLFPPDWLNGAEEVARQLTRASTGMITLGVDPAEGGDKSSWTVADRRRLIEQVSIPTPNTRVVPTMTIDFIKRYDIKPQNVLFDAGGGGKIHSDYLRERGYDVRTVAFGSPVNPKPKAGTTFPKEKVEHKEQRYVYKNIRAQLYGELSDLIDPARGESVYGIPAEMTELRRQLSLIPKTYDEEGRLYILPKRKKTKESTQKTLEEILGCSPDEADSAVLAVHGQLHRSETLVLGGWGG